MRTSPILLLFLVMALLPLACSDDAVPPAEINILSLSLNGANLSDGLDNVPVSSTLTIVFSAAIIPTSFEKEFTVSPTPLSVSFSYSNQSSKVTVELSLEYQTAYQVQVGDGTIGQNGGQLEGPLSRTFTTTPDGIIYSMPPCSSASADCLQTISITGNGTGNFDFFSSFPIYEEMAEWKDLEAAIIVIHGVNRDADNYFNFLTGALQAEGLESKVALIAPFFKNDSEASGEDLYWSGAKWREGQNSIGSASISSFEVIDQLVEQLADTIHFPVLKKVIVTGHSSGALFTHLYAAANKVEAQHPHIAFEYVPANSQYYYYPDGQRILESTNQLYTPSGCTGYDFWPMGFHVVPSYVATMDEATFNMQFVDRSITYLLGNEAGVDSALNTTDCFATLLGSTRFNRGENMFQYMELAFPGGHNHKKAIVNGVGHDGQGMYQSPEFRSWLGQLLN